MDFPQLWLPDWSQQAAGVLGKPAFHVVTAASPETTQAQHNIPVVGTGGQDCACSFDCGS